MGYLASFICCPRLEAASKHTYTLQK